MVGSRAFHAVVFVLWSATMGWLVMAKVMPPLRVGDPPTYRSTLPAPEHPICWKLHWNSRQIGWAATRRIVSGTGVTDIHNCLRIDSLPIEEIAPAWLGSLLRNQVGPIDLVAFGRMQIDPFGQLSEFESSVRFSELEDAISVRGRVVDSQLKLHVTIGQLDYHKEIFFDERGLLGNELAPQAKLAGLRLGQTWTMRVYSPFRSPNSPLEIVQATVEEEAFFTWETENGEPESVPVWIVVFRNDSGSALGSSGHRGKMWVRRERNPDLDGQVLQQEVSLLNSRLRFVRMTETEAKSYKEQLDADWRNPLPTMSPLAPEAPAQR